jgi:O-6-methylguanine DNA methyltransferase
MAHLELLREQWKTLYSRTLPQLAKARDPAQTKWPVTLDHCFARIILDNTVGQGIKRWDEVISKPAWSHMTAAQLKDAIELGKNIQTGQIDLVELDQISLMARGKSDHKYGQLSSVKKEDAVATNPKKRSLEEAASPPTRKQHKEADGRQSTLPFARSSSSKNDGLGVTESKAMIKDQAEPPIDFKAVLDQIQSHPSLTPYRKRLYTILLSVPRGRYTTYASMSDFLDSSARAVGNGMRNNPFAPEVPCHRVLAADGSLGGFKGDWGREGKYANDKLALLRKEGVKFDGKGKVVGEPFRNFHEFKDL